MEVINGEIQVVAGLNYRLILTANNESVTKKFQAEVFEQGWTHIRILNYFVPK